MGYTVHHVHGKHQNVIILHNFHVSSMAVTDGWNKVPQFKTLNLRFGGRELNLE
jgi:hypothetical protein